MEKKHKEGLSANFLAEIKNKRLVILDIPDEYEYMDKELIEMIKLSVDSDL